MNRNASAYSLLFAIHSHLAAKHRVPPHTSESYRLTISHILPLYAHNPQLANQLQKSIPIRNKVCHFKLVTNQDLILLKSICVSLKINTTIRAAHHI